MREMETVYVLVAIIAIAGSIVFSFKYPPQPDVYDGYLGIFPDRDIPTRDNATAEGSLPGSLDRDPTRN
jgi:hypothetical protein